MGCFNFQGFLCGVQPRLWGQTKRDRWRRGQPDSHNQPLWHLVAILRQNARIECGARQVFMSIRNPSSNGPAVRASQWSWNLNRFPNPIPLPGAKSPMLRVFRTSSCSQKTRLSRSQQATHYPCWLESGEVISAIITRVEGWRWNEVISRQDDFFVGCYN